MASPHKRLLHVEFMCGASDGTLAQLWQACATGIAMCGSNARRKPITSKDVNTYLTSSMQRVTTFSYPGMLSAVTSHSAASSWPAAARIHVKTLI